VRFVKNIRESRKKKKASALGEREDPDRNTGKLKEKSDSHRVKSRVRNQGRRAPTIESGTPNRSVRVLKKTV